MPTRRDQDSEHDMIKFCSQCAKSDRCMKIPRYMMKGNVMYFSCPGLVRWEETDAR